MAQSLLEEDDNSGIDYGLLECGPDTALRVSNEICNVCSDSSPSTRR